MPIPVCPTLVAIICAGGFVIMENLNVRFQAVTLFFDVWFMLSVSSAFPFYC